MTSHARKLDDRPHRVCSRRGRPLSSGCRERGTPRLNYGGSLRPKFHAGVFRGLTQDESLSAVKVFRSVFVCSVGVSAWANHCVGAFARQNHLKNICSLNRVSRNSGAHALRSGLTTRPRFLPNAHRSPSKTQTRSCAAIAGSPRDCSSSSWTRSTEYPRGVWYGSQGPQRIVIGRSFAVHSTRLASFSDRIDEPTSVCFEYLRAGVRMFFARTIRAKAQPVASSVLQCDSSLRVSANIKFISRMRGAA